MPKALFSHTHTMPSKEQRAKARILIFRSRQRQGPFPSDYDHHVQDENVTNQLRTANEDIGKQRYRKQHWLLDEDMQLWD